MNYEITTRIQWISPDTPPYEPYHWIGMESDGTQYSQVYWEDGDSWYQTWSVTGGSGVINFRNEVHLEYLEQEDDSMVIDIEVASDPLELILNVERYAAMPVGNHIYKIRIDLQQHPYFQRKLSDVSTEANITLVTFEHSPYWVTTILGSEERGREYYFLRLSGFSISSPNFNFLSKYLGLPSFPTPGIKQSCFGYP